MNSHSESAEQKELWEAMDIVIGATPASAQTEDAAPSLEEIQPIVDRIQKRERQREWVARAAA